MVGDLDNDVSRGVWDKMYEHTGEIEMERESHTVQGIEGDKYIARFKNSYLQAWVFRDLSDSNRSVVLSHVCKAIRNDSLAFCNRVDIFLDTPQLPVPDFSQLLLLYIYLLVFKDGLLTDA